MEWNEEICMFMCCVCLCLCLCFYVHVYKRVNISILVICYHGDVIEYDRRRSELFNAPLHVKQDTASIE